MYPPNVHLVGELLSTLVSDLSAGLKIHGVLKKKKKHSICLTYIPQEYGQINSLVSLRGQRTLEIVHDVVRGKIIGNQGRLIKPHKIKEANIRA